MKNNTKELYDSNITQALNSTIQSLSTGDICCWLSDEIETAYENLSRSFTDFLINLMKNIEPDEAGVRRLKVKSHFAAFGKTVTIKWNHRGLISAEYINNMNEPISFTANAPEFDTVLPLAAARQEIINDQLNNAVLSILNRYGKRNITHYAATQFGVDENSKELIKLNTLKSKCRCVIKQINETRIIYERYTDMSEYVHDYCTSDKMIQILSTEYDTEFDKRHAVQSYLNTLYISLINMFPEFCNEKIDNMLNQINDITCKYKKMLEQYILPDPNKYKSLFTDTTEQDIKNWNIDRMQSLTITDAKDHCILSAFRKIRRKIINMDAFADTPTCKLSEYINDRNNISEAGLTRELYDSADLIRIGEFRKLLYSPDLNNKLDAKTTFTDKEIDELFNKECEEHQYLLKIFESGIKTIFQAFAYGTSDTQPVYTKDDDTLAKMSLKINYSDPESRNKLISMIENYIRQPFSEQNLCAYGWNPILPVICSLQKDDINTAYNQEIRIIEHYIKNITSIQNALLQSDNKSFIQYMADKKIVGKREANTRLKELESQH